MSVTLFIWTCSRCGFLPHLCATVLKATTSQQQDCAPPYYAVSGTEYVGNRFNGRRIGHGYRLVSPKSKPNNTWQFVFRAMWNKTFFYVWVPNRLWHSAVATDLEHPYWIYIIPTHGMHQWLLLQLLVLLMMGAESVRNMQRNLAVTNKQYCQSCILLVLYII